ncbi:MAG: rRNA maturation RNase YbeY [Chitinophagaceae bacterium]|nr:rRNA maturation RNase YbeY [Chitinophagaceae bacterium]
MPSINFFFPYKHISLRQRSQLKDFIRKTFKKKKKKLISLNYIFCSDTELLEINRQFLRHDFFTDILTFNLSDTGEIEGEIYISAERVKENARLLHTTIIEELHRVIFHGILHLCGFRDKSKEEKSEMRKQEDLLLKTYFKRK